MKSTHIYLSIALMVLFIFCGVAHAWNPVPVKQDPLVRMPGTQPPPENNVTLEAPTRCTNCHGGFNTAVEPAYNWKGSMMAQAARDPLFWACMTVSAQDSIWAVGRPNATDICLRCHFPQGWIEGRSDPTNASLMTGNDYSGVHCDVCHHAYDPFFETTYTGTREGNDWKNYWDETNLSGTPSNSAAQKTYAADKLLAQTILDFNKFPFYGLDSRPLSLDFTENASGQMFLSGTRDKRASFADASARHNILYSRYHKSKYICSTCHDVSNPVLANLGADPSQPLPTEVNPAHSYFHVERTFSEFMLSAYAQQGGSAGLGPFAPGSFKTSYPTNYIAKCQDCHMKDGVGKAASQNDAVNRPSESTEHPNSGQPVHDMTGGNVWISSILASTITGSPNYNATNAQLLRQGSSVLTLDLSLGEPMDAAALLAGANRARQQLQMAAAIQNAAYNSTTGSLSFRIQNQTGHKLISGFPEGRRMFVNIKAYNSSNNLIYEVNPYDYTSGTLRGMPASQTLGPNEAHVDELVYEMKPTSSLTQESKTFHFALATGRYKDNRIPPKGFRISEAAVRLSVPVSHGIEDPNLFTAAEYAGGYDDVSLAIVPGAAYVEIKLYYQTTSREYIEFLRDEINGTGSLTLSSPTPSGEAEAYVVQSDPFFAQLKAWGNTIWQLWQNNMNIDGAKPFLMAETTVKSTLPDDLIQKIRSLVREYYIDILDREPDVAGWDYWTNEILRIINLGIYVGEGFQAEARLFFNSNEYVVKNKTNTQFVTDLYQTFLQREPDAGGLAYWAGELSCLTRNMLITQFAYSNEFQTYMTSIFGANTTRPENNLVNDFYRGILGRLPDDAGFNGWLEDMRTAQCTNAQAVEDLSYELSLLFVQSGEYTGRNRNNVGYVEDLYNAILRRGADCGGFQSWVDNLDSGMSRVQLLQLFTASPEFQTRVDALIAAGCLP